jgi:hypothetical protein
MIPNPIGYCDAVSFGVRLALGRFCDPAHVRPEAYIKPKVDQPRACIALRDKIDLFGLK